MCCFFNKAYLRVPFDIIKQYKVILLYHCWNHVVFSFIVVKDAASHSTNYSLPRGGGWYRVSMSQFEALHFIQFMGSAGKNRKNLYKVGRGSSFEWSELWGPFEWRNIING